MNMHDNPPGDGGLHPRIYTLMVGLAIWLVLSIWLFFGRGGYVGLALAMITLFFLILVGIPSLLWLVWRRNAGAGEIGRHPESLREWASQGFDTWTEHLSGRAAAIQLLLPIAAVAFGMTIFGLVYYFDLPQLS